MTTRRPTLPAPAWLTLALTGAAAIALAVACAPSRVSPAAAEADPPCACELRSWVVAGRGRHLLLDIDCPPPNDHLTGVVEFANTAMREDFDWRRDPAGAPRIARMTPGVRVLPLLPNPHERVEARWSITPQTAACLARDRVFSETYFLVGPNSNSAMRAVCEECGVTLPDTVLAGGGVLGEFPGVERSPGQAIPPEAWPAVGARRAAP